MYGYFVASIVEGKPKETAIELFRTAMGKFYDTHGRAIALLESAREKSPQDYLARGVSKVNNGRMIDIQGNAAREDALKHGGFYIMEEAVLVARHSSGEPMREKLNILMAAAQDYQKNVEPLARAYFAQQSQDLLR